MPSRWRSDHTTSKGPSETLGWVTSTAIQPGASRLRAPTDRVEHSEAGSDGFVDGEPSLLAGEHGLGRAKGGVCPGLNRDGPAGEWSSLPVEQPSTHAGI